MATARTAKEMAANGLKPEVRKRILDATLELLGRRGPDLSISSVAEEASLSRATIYRYFANRDELIDAVDEHMWLLFRDGLKQIVATTPPDQYRDAVIDYCVKATIWEPGRQLCDLQPKLALMHIRQSMGKRTRLLHSALKPVYDQLNEERSQPIDTMPITRIIGATLVANYFSPQRNDVGKVKRPGIGDCSFS